MRVLVISDVSSHMRGGVPAEARTLINGLTERGHVVALCSDAPLAACERAQHIPISLPVTAALSVEIGAALALFRPDFVHVLCMNSKGVMQLAALLHDRPWALTVHSLPPHERKLARWHGHEAVHYGARAMRFFANSLAWRWVLGRGMVPVAIVHSRYVGDIVARYGCRRERIRQIPLAFLPDSSARVAIPGDRPGNAPRLLTVGGFAHTKGQHDMVKALPVLLARFPGLSYQIVGEIRDESYLHHLRELAERLGVSQALHITPDLSNADRQSALAAADVYVQTSHEEGFCLAYAEAADVVPRLVGTDTGAMAMLSEDDPGARIVPVRDPAALAHAVTDLLESVLPANLMVARVARLSDVFSVERYLRAHEAVYAAER